ncbi:MAG TPA: hypothetical protein VF662_13860 [Allosphingosinicella sp.]|jgi:hypothetical protein
MIWFDLGSGLQQAGDFLRRHIKSKAVREAEKRRRERKARNAARRFGRATAVAGTSGAGLFAYTLAVAPISTAGLAAAGAATLIAATAALAWPGSRGAKQGFSGAELAALPAEAEDWLLTQREHLPAKADPALDNILLRLGDLQPRLGEIGPNSTLAWEARRLIGEHLPGLVSAYTELPRTTREADPALRQHLVAGLETIAEELDRICREVSRERLTSLEARSSFLKTRYRDEA